MRDSGRSHPLHSWKDIARFFDRDVRTVQRWEKEEGMPVHRHSHGRQSSVFAYPQELEEWWIGHQSGASSSGRPWARVAWTVAASLLLIAVAVLVAFRLQRPSTLETANAGDAVLTVYGPSQGVQVKLTRAGDFNGDGLTDLAFTAVGNGQTYMVFGRRPPLPGGNLAEIAEVTLKATEPGLWLNTYSGDFNGDGLDDLFITHMLGEKDGYSATGSSYLIFGRKTWPDALLLPQEADVALTFDWAPDARMSHCHPNGNPWDLNGDGLEDFGLSVPEYGVQGQKSAGGIFVLLGRPNWPPTVEVTTESDLSILGSRMGQGLGAPCTLGDYNGDGLMDLLAYANHATLWELLKARGQAYIFMGREAWPSTLSAPNDADVIVGEGVPEADWGVAISADVNGDSRSDLVMARTRQNRSDRPAGEVRIWLGGWPQRGPHPEDSAEIVLKGDKAGSSLGQSIVNDDLDGDGCDDLLISEPSSGRIHLLWGNPDWEKGRFVGEVSSIVLLTTELSVGEGNLELADVDNDGLRELLAAAPEAVAGSDENAGRAWAYRLFRPLRIDVRPGQDPDVILSGRGVTAVQVSAVSKRIGALKSGSIRLMGIQPLRSTLGDFDGDGLGDYQAYFDNAQLKIEPGTRRITVTARTEDDRPAAGVSIVEVHP